MAAAVCGAGEGNEEGLVTKLPRLKAARCVSLQWVTRHVGCHAPPMWRRGQRHGPRGLVLGKGAAPGAVGMGDGMPPFSAGKQGARRGEGAGRRAHRTDELPQRW